MVISYAVYSSFRKYVADNHNEEIKKCRQFYYLQQIRKPFQIICRTVLTSKNKQNAMG